MSQDVDVGGCFPAARDQDRDLTNTRLGLWVGVGPRWATVPDRAPVRPTWSAGSRVPTLTACAITAVPSGEDDRPVDHDVIPSRLIGRELWGCHPVTSVIAHGGQSDASGSCND